MSLFLLQIKLMQHSQAVNDIYIQMVIAGFCSVVDGMILFTIWSLFNENLHQLKLNMLQHFTSHLLYLTIFTLACPSSLANTCVSAVSKTYNT